MTLEEVARELDMDLERSLDLVVNNRSLLIRLLKAYINDTYMTTARQALKQKDYQTAGEQVHSMKGAGASLGLDHIAGLCNDMVTAVRQKEYERVDGLFARVEQEYSKLESVLGRLN